MRTYLPKHYAKLDKAYNDWMDKVKRVPAKYPTLTEKQWMEACRYFDGCARCHSKDIDSRGFFIGFEVGGRYCDWNIIPLCERCSKTWALNKNPFLNAERRDRLERSDYEYRENLYNIIEYLGGKLDDAVEHEKGAETNG